MFMASSAAIASRTAARDDTPRLAGVLAAAFADDPIFDWLLPDDRRIDRLRRFFTLELRALVLPRGDAWTADDVAGTALSLPPGAWRMPLTVTLGHGRAFARVFGRRLGRATGLLTVMESRHLREPHVYIPYVGVAPEHQGRGFGTALMRPILDGADAAGLPTYLEATCERNIALYQRLGFRVTGELRFLNSPPLTPMRREPHAG